ncbi:hypothetical protein MKX01_005487 [Papaver californicum]|nr:hypothetical protein MKX01_005487 [Papaver californicum]
MTRSLTAKSHLILFGRKKLDSKNYNYKGLKSTKINNTEGKEDFYGYACTGKYLNNGESMDFESNNGQFMNFGTHRPVELQPSNNGYTQYIGSGYPPIIYGPQTLAEIN